MPTPYGFENGAPNIKIESDGRVHPMVKTAGHSDTSAGEYVANVEYFNFASAFVSSAELCSDNKSEGNYSLKFVKSASGYLAFYTIRNVKELMGPNGTFSFDLYSTVQANGNAQVTNFQDGRNQVSLGTHYANEWHTYTLDGSQITDDGRFLILQGSTAGDWYIDNIRINYAA